MLGFSVLENFDTEHFLVDNKCKTDSDCNVDDNEVCGIDNKCVKNDEVSKMCPDGLPPQKFSDPVAGDGYWCRLGGNNDISAHQSDSNLDPESINNNDSDELENDKLENDKLENDKLENEDQDENKDDEVENNETEPNKENETEPNKENETDDSENENADSDDDKVHEVNNLSDTVEGFQNPVSNILNLDLLLRSLLFGCLFYIISHKNTVNMIIKFTGKNSDNLLLLSSLAFVVLYYLINLIL